MISCKKKLSKYEQLFTGLFLPSQLPYLKTLSKTEAYTFAEKQRYYWHSPSHRWVPITRLGSEGTLKFRNTNWWI